MEFYIIDTFSSPKVIYVFDTQIMPSLASRKSFTLVPVTFSLDYSILGPLPCFLTPRDISGSSCTFSPLDLEINCLPKEPWFLLVQRP